MNILEIMFMLGIFWKFPTTVFLLTGEVLGITEEDEETGEGLRVAMQLNGEILNQSIEIDFKDLEEDLIEMRHIHDDEELIIEIL